MINNKPNTSLSANTIMDKLTNHFQRTRLITSTTDKHYSLDFEDDFRSGCRNVSHQQQLFSLRTILTRRIIQFELLILLCSNHLLCYITLFLQTHALVWSFPASFAFQVPCFSVQISFDNLKENETLKLLREKYAIMSKPQTVSHSRLQSLSVIVQYPCLQPFKVEQGALCGSHIVAIMS